MCKKKLNQTTITQSKFNEKLNEKKRGDGNKDTEQILEIKIKYETNIMNKCKCEKEWESKGR